MDVWIPIIGITRLFGVSVNCTLAVETFALTRLLARRGLSDYGSSRVSFSWSISHIASAERVHRLRNMAAESKSTRSVSKRVSTVPAPPKAPATIDPSAVLANHCVLTGLFPITVGARAVLHPHSKVVSTAGPVE